MGIFNSWGGMAMMGGEGMKSWEADTPLESMPTIRGSSKGFKRGSKLRVQNFSKIIWGLPMEVGVTFSYGC